MTPREVAIRVALAGRLSVLPDDMKGRHLTYTAAIGLIRWDIDVPTVKGRGYVLTDAGRAAVGDIQPERPKRDRKSKRTLADRIADAFKEDAL